MQPFGVSRSCKSENTDLAFFRLRAQRSFSVDHDFVALGGYTWLSSLKAG